jgi:uncharacterized protein (TIGR02186 family)
MTLRGFFCWLLGWFMLATCLAQATPRIVADLSERRVDIEYKFVGKDILLFGAVVGLAANTRPDVVVVLRGPQLPVTVRYKSRVAGIWLNTSAVDFRTAPSYYALASNRSLDDVAAAQWRAIYELGVDSLHFSTVNSGDITAFQNGFIQLRRNLGLFQENETGVEIMENSLFRTRLTLPPRVPVGDYRIEIYLFDRKRLIARQSIPLTVGKSGFERGIYEFAHKSPLEYGIVAVTIALVSGWLAASVMRRKP